MCHKLLAHSVCYFQLLFEKDLTKSQFQLDYSELSGDILISKLFG